MILDTSKLIWTREPEQYTIANDRIEIVTEPHTDLWQRTYYHFRNDNAPLLQMETNEKYFSFVVKTEFDSKHRFDQCGIVMYLDSDNWLKASIEYENNEIEEMWNKYKEEYYERKVLIFADQPVPEIPETARVKFVTQGNVLIEYEIVEYPDEQE